jgi:hypothetical protein
MKALVYTAPCEVVHRDEPEPCPGAFGDLAWVEERPLADGARALDDLHHGRSAAAKILVRP